MYYPPTPEAEAIAKEFGILRGDPEINSIEDCHGYQFIDTPSHGFLIVPKGDKNFSIAKKICEGYGYRGPLALYLEEDCQAPEFLKAIGAIKEKSKVQLIEENETYKELMKDSFGGVMYDLGKKDSYQARYILSLWEAMTPEEQERAGGVMKGAFRFLTNK